MVGFLCWTSVGILAVLSYGISTVARGAHTSDVTAHKHGIVTLAAHVG